jgi:hypothetical protein
MWKPKSATASAAWRVGASLALFWVLLALLVSGCSGPTSSDVSSLKAKEKSYIMGAVIESSRATTSETAKDTLGTIDVEGSRSQAITEALVTVTKNTRILDKRGSGAESATFDTIKERETVEVWFDVLTSAPDPWYARATKIIICP